MQVTPREKRVEFELIRAIAILCVVYIHAASVVVNNFAKVAPVPWFFLTYLDAVIRWCVPVFVMVSGSLLLQKSEPHLSFVKRRLGRIGLPLLIWLPLYWLAVALFSPPLPSWKELWISVVYEQPYIHMYFLFVMVQLAVLTPWLRSVVRSLTRRSLALLIILFLYIGMAYQPHTKFVLFLFIPYLGYYLYGFFAKDLTLRTRRNKLIGLAAIALTAVVMVLVQYGLIQGSLQFRGLTKPTEVVAYLSPFVVLMSVLAFPLLNDPAVLRRFTRVFATKWITSVGECSFGIYLIHPILQLALIRFFPNLFSHQLSNPISTTLGLTVGLFMTSWGIAWLIKRTAKLRWLL